MNLFAMPIDKPALRGLDDNSLWRLPDDAQKPIAETDPLGVLCAIGMQFRKHLREPSQVGIEVDRLGRQ